MKCKRKVEGLIDFDVGTSIVSILGFKKQTYTTGDYTADKILDIVQLSRLNATTVDTYGI